MRQLVLPPRGRAMLATITWFLHPARGLPMPAPTPLPLRQAVARRHQRGEAPAAIARALGLPPRTVRLLLRRWRRPAGAALAPAYRRGERPRTEAAQRLHDRALALRRGHPTWGAGLIRVLLRRQHPPEQVDRKSVV